MAPAVRQNLMKVSIIAVACAIGAAKGPTVKNARGSRHLSKVTKSIIPRGFTTYQVAPSCTITDIEDRLNEKANNPSSESYSNFLLDDTGEAPSTIKCGLSEELCPYYSYKVPSVDTSNLEDYEPSVSNKPCIRCEFVYESLQSPSCDELSCDLYNCLDEEGAKIVRPLADEEQEDDGGQTCFDTPGWEDYMGSGCDWYEANSDVDICNEMADFGAKDHCCLCGGGVGQARNLQTGDPELHFDGVYMFQFQDYNIYLRFYENGTVYQFYAPPEMISSWIDIDKMWSSRGNYTATPGWILFSLTNETGTMNYSGIIDGRQDQLILFLQGDTIGNVQLTSMYIFVPMDFEGDTLAPTGLLPSDIRGDTVPPTANGTCNSTLYGIAQFGALYQINKDTGQLMFITNSLYEANAAATDSMGHLFAMTRVDANVLYQINATTGTYDRIVVTGVPSGSGGVLSMAIDSHDNLFAVIGLGTLDNLQYIYKIDLVLGNATALARDVGFLQGCAIDTWEDDMYCVNSNNTLIKIDPYSGEKKKVIDIPHSYGSGGTDLYQGIEYDPCENKIWMTYSGLASYNLKDRTITEVTELKDTRLFGLFVTTTGTLPSRKNDTIDTDPPVPTNATATGSMNPSNIFQHNNSTPGFPGTPTGTPTGAPTSSYWFSTGTPTIPSAGFLFPTPSPTWSSTTLSSIDVDSGQTSPPMNRTQVTVCREIHKFESFIVTLVEDDYQYSCGWETATREVHNEFKQGVTNIRETSWVLGEPTDQSYLDESDMTLSDCTYLVDGVECNSCELCDLYSNSEYEANCSNIVAGAITSCDGAFFDNMEFYLFVLQEGYVDPAQIEANDLAQLEANDPAQIEANENGNENGAFSNGFRIALTTTLAGYAVPLMLH